MALVPHPAGQGFRHFPASQEKRRGHSRSELQSSSVTVKNTNNTLINYMIGENCCTAFRQFTELTRNSFFKCRAQLTCSASVVGVALVAVGTRAGHCFEWSVVNDLTHGTGATRVNHLAEVLALPINATLQSRAVLVTAAFCRGRWRAESVRVSTVPFEALACCSAILHKTFRIGYTLLEVTRVHALSLTALLAVRALGVVLAA